MDCNRCSLWAGRPAWNSGEENTITSDVRYDGLMQGIMAGQRIAYYPGWYIGTYYAHPMGSLSLSVSVLPIVFEAIGWPDWGMDSAPWSEHLFATKRRPFWRNLAAMWNTSTMCTPTSLRPACVRAYDNVAETWFQNQSFQNCNSVCTIHLVTCNARVQQDTMSLLACTRLVTSQFSMRD